MVGEKCCNTEKVEDCWGQYLQTLQAINRSFADENWQSCFDLMEILESQWAEILKKHRDNPFAMTLLPIQRLKLLVLENQRKFLDRTQSKEVECLKNLKRLKQVKQLKRN